MWRIIFGIFFILHGLVHLLYFGQSRRFFELQPGMLWPDGSWAFSRLLGDPISRLVVSVFLAAAAIGFAAGGTGLLAGQAWGRAAVIGSAILSTATFLLFWNGQMQKLPDQGAVAILINAVILAALLLLRWPV